MSHHSNLKNPLSFPLVSIIFISLQFLTTVFTAESFRIRQFRCGHFQCRDRQMTLYSDEDLSSKPLSLRDRRKNKRAGKFDETREVLETKVAAAVESYLNMSPNEDGPSYITPLDFQLDKINNEHIKFYGFDNLFPNSNLGEVFDLNGNFRTAIRVAVRNDYYILDLSLSDEANSLIRDPRSTLMSNWINHSKEYTNLSQIFLEYGIKNINGDLFMKTLTALCGQSPHLFGSWIDIIGIKNRKISHSWYVLVHFFRL